MQFDLVGKMESISDWGPSLVKRLGLAKVIKKLYPSGFFLPSTVRWLSRGSVWFAR